MISEIGKKIIKRCETYFEIFFYRNSIYWVKNIFLLVCLIEKLYKKKAETVAFQHIQELVNDL